LTHSVASSCCTMSPALCGTMQCLSTAHVSHSSSNNDISSSKSSDSRSDASAEVTKAVSAIGSITNWQYVQQHATGGAGLQPSFGQRWGHCQPAISWWCMPVWPPCLWCFLDLSCTLLYVRCRHAHFALHVQPMQFTLDALGHHSCCLVVQTFIC